MKLLLVDTAFESCVVGLAVDEQLLERSALARRSHAKLLLPWVQELLAEAQLSLTQLDAIAFGRGPGGFTSLRLGISVVQGLAWGADLGVVPVSSLHSVAQSGLRSHAPVLVAMDARMNEVFAGRFEPRDGLMRPVGNEQVCTAQQALQMAHDGDIGLGNGFSRYAPLQSPGVFESVRDNAWPGARAIYMLACDWLEQNQALAAEQAQPVYLRDKVAKKSSEQGSAI